MLRNRDQYRRALQVLAALRERIESGESDAALLSRYDAGMGEILAYEWAEQNARPLSRHAELELAHLAHRSWKVGDPLPLGAGQPVPGCGCATCCTLTAGGSYEDAREAEAAVEVLASSPTQERVRIAEGWAAERQRLGREVLLPSPWTLAHLAGLRPGAMRSIERQRRRQTPGSAVPRAKVDLTEQSRPALPVEEARRADLLAVAAQLGLGEARKAGAGEYVVRCPLHEDRKPSMTLTPARGLWYCFPCGRGGDVITLVQAARGVPFREAVLELAGAAQ
jgi:hypothetical protein